MEQDPRVAQATGRPVISSVAGREGSLGNDARMYAMSPPFLENTGRWTLMTVDSFSAFPAWRPVMSFSVEERKRAFADPAVRAALRADADGPDRQGNTPAVRWDLVYVSSAALPANQGLVERSVTEIAQEQGKEPLDAFLDLALEEEFGTYFYQRSDMSVEAIEAILTDPHVLVGLSDGGAHVSRRCDSHFSTFLLSYWVRERGAMSLEEAVRKLTFMSATAFGMYDRGLIRPGLAADLTVFDPDTIAPGDLDQVADYPAEAVRMRRLCDGVDYTIVNGEVLIEHGEHTGALPGQVIRSSAYRG